MNTQSGDRNHLVINVHIEPDLTLRNPRERLRLITPHWPLYPEALGVISVDFTICEPEEGRFNVWNQTFTDRDAGKAALFHSFFFMSSNSLSLTLQGEISTADGTVRTLSRIDRTFTNLPVAEARDIHCYSHVFENLGERFIPSDHAAVRVVIQKPTIRGHQGKRNPSMMSKHSVSCSILKQMSDDHQYPDDPFVALADFKVILEKVRERTVHELLRETPGSPAAKLLTASTALRAYRNRHLGTLMHCCEAWEPVGKCFDQCSFECIVK